VPNILVNGVSIGGGDDIAEMDSSNTLTEKIKEFAAKKVLDIRLRPAEAGDDSHGLR
jgi:hypothetical protein